MKTDIPLDWRGLVRAVLRAALPFLTGALSGYLCGCSFYGSGIGLTAAL